MVTTVWSSPSTGSGQYADVNGIHLYYEAHGSGRPLILLHGGLGSGEMFGPVLPMLAAEHEVIAVDLQGHGRTADIERPLRADLMAGDIAALITHLGLEKADLFGYSLGGGVAFWTAVQHPELVDRLVMVSAHVRRDAIYPAMLGEQAKVGPEAAEALKGTPMYELYARVAPRPEDFPKLLGKIGEAMAVEFDFSDQVRGLEVADPVRLRRRQTCSRQAMRSRCSGCSAVASAMAAGWARVGLPAATPWPSCRG